MSNEVRPLNGDSIPLMSLLIPKLSGSRFPDEIGILWFKGYGRIILLTLLMLLDD